MFQFYKQRDFSAFISDTIAFFRIYWKNFFGNYIILTGGLVALLCVFYFFVLRDLFEVLFNTADHGTGYDISYYFPDNPVLFMSCLLLVIVLGIFISFVSLSYPLIYMKLSEETGRADLTASEIFERIKKMLPRICRFALYFLVTFLPIIVLGAILASVMIFLVVGIFILLLLVPMSIVWVMQSFSVYLLNDVSLKKAMKQGWEILFSRKFWPIVGSVLVIYLIITIIQSVFTVIPYVIAVFSRLVEGGGVNASEYSVITGVFYIVSLILSYLFSNFMTVNQCLVYYSSQEQKHHTQALSEIDTIGQNVE